MSTRAWLLWLILGTTCLRFGWAAILETSNDEGYHFLYTRFPALSYFDHPPMTMWLEVLGLTIFGGWEHPLSLRFAFVVMFAGSLWILYRWTSDHFGERAGIAAVIALNLSAYYTAAGGVFALPDGPFLFFALLTFWQVCRAITFHEPSAIRPWLWVGLGFGGALLSKYHGVFLPAGVVLFAILTPGKRWLFLRPGPYIAVLIGLVCFAPVIVWNLQNDWASFKFQGGRAVGMTFRPEGLLGWFFGPFLYLTPWIWFALVRELWVRRRGWRTLPEIDRLNISLAVVPLVFFGLVSCVRWTLLHWPLVGFVPLYPLLGQHWANFAAAKPRLAKKYLPIMAFALLGFMVFALAQARLGLISFGSMKDPAADVSGWESVADEILARKLLDEPGVFLFTNRWYDSGQLAFALRHHTDQVTCYNSIDARGFYFWNDADLFVGRTGYLLAIDTDPSEEAIRKEYEPHFAQIYLSAEFPMSRNGKPFRKVRLYRCEKQILPFPIAYRLPTP